MIDFINETGWNATAIEISWLAQRCGIVATPEQLLTFVTALQPILEEATSDEEEDDWPSDEEVDPLRGEEGAA
jgi:hypothetical protein